MQNGAARAFDLGEQGGGNFRGKIDERRARGVGRERTFERRDGIRDAPEAVCALGVEERRREVLLPLAACAFFGLELFDLLRDALHHRRIIGGTQGVDVEVERERGEEEGA